MKVYVDTSKFESHDIQSITDLGGKEFKQIRLWFEDTDNVEIQSLADYTKQVRKEVIDEICVDYAKRLSAFIGVKISISTAMEKLKEVLDQIQGETK